jgi:hypothetical protein
MKTPGYVFAIDYRWPKGMEIFEEGVVRVSCWVEVFITFYDRPEFKCTRAEIWVDRGGTI